MQNQDFRALLETNSDELKGYTAPSGGGGGRGGKFSVDDVKSMDRENERKAKQKLKKKQRGGTEKAPEKKEPSYRDRAAERRNGDGDVEQQIPATSSAGRDEGEQYSIEKSKFLGGDMENTHLVRGLDFNLLRKARAETAGEQGNEDDDDGEVEYHALRPNKGGTPMTAVASASVSASVQAAPPPPGLPGLVVVGSGAAAQAVAAYKKRKEAEAAGAHQVLLNKAAAAGYAQQPGTEWISRLSALSIHPPKEDGQGRRVLAAWQETAHGCCSRYGRALRRVTYHFSKTSAGSLPTQSLSSSSTGTLSANAGATVSFELAGPLLARIKAALSGSRGKADKRKRKTHHAAHPVAPIPKHVPESVVAPASNAAADDDDDDDIFAGAGDYQPVGALDDDATIDVGAPAADYTRSVFDGIDRDLTTQPSAKRSKP